MLPRHHKALWLDHQPVGDSVDIVEVRGDLYDVVDVAVVEAMRRNSAISSTPTLQGARVRCSAYSSMAQSAGPSGAWR